MLIADSQASPWHRGGPLPLLPSGPDGVCGTHLHGTRLPAINIPAASHVGLGGNLCLTDFLDYNQQRGHHFQTTLALAPRSETDAFVPEEIGHGFHKRVRFLEPPFSLFTIREDSPIVAGAPRTERRL
jgi:hypothetical protein